MMASWQQTNDIYLDTSLANEFLPQRSTESSSVVFYAYLPIGFYELESLDGFKAANCKVATALIM